MSRRGPDPSVGGERWRDTEETRRREGASREAEEARGEYRCKGNDTKVRRLCGARADDEGTTTPGSKQRRRGWRDAPLKRTRKVFCREEYRCPSEILTKS